MKGNLSHIPSYTSTFNSTALAESFGKKEKGNFFEMRKFYRTICKQALKQKNPETRHSDTEKPV
jgi:hypothetical protein